MERKIKINIVSPGRFHVCDLARELDKQGFDVKFYSFVPQKRAMKFGLPAKCSKSLIGVMAPFLFLERKIFPKKIFFKQLRVTVQDFITSIYMRRCDILISMSGSFLRTPRIAKKHNSIIIIERGSKHILEQKRILDGMPGVNKFLVPKRNVRRELECYVLADYIAIASQHVKKSFELHHYPLNKLFINPYGVDLSMFKPLPIIEKKYDFIMVGGWSYQKGCDLIINAVKNTNYTLLHVGGIGDVEMPKDKQFTHIDPVDQSKLITYYNQSKVFILPSRQDGFGMVLTQAMACNLPIVSSKDCGAPDLKNMVEYPQYITIIEDYTVNSLLAAMEDAMRNYETLQNKIYAGNAIRNLTWEAYGKRYAAFINSINLKR